MKKFTSLPRFARSEGVVRPTASLHSVGGLEFTIERPRGFRLGAAASFYSGFVPGSGMAAAEADGERLTLAFRLDGTYEAVVVALREQGSALIA